MSVCQSYSSPLICPTDGPDYNATDPGTGKYPFSNNALESCFMSDHSILPSFSLLVSHSRSQCLTRDLFCGENPKHPECISVGHLRFPTF